MHPPPKPRKKDYLTDGRGMGQFLRDSAAWAEKWNVWPWGGPKDEDDDFTYEIGDGPMTTVLEMHDEKIVHRFPKFFSEDVRFLTLALAGEVGELCNLIKKNWRDGTDVKAEIRDEIADIYVYHQLLTVQATKPREGEYGASSPPDHYERRDAVAALDLFDEVNKLSRFVVSFWDDPRITGSSVRETLYWRLVRIRQHIEVVARMFDIGGERLEQHAVSKLTSVIKRLDIRDAERRIRNLPLTPD